MKVAIMLCLSFLCVTNLFAQHSSIVFNFNDVHVGRNVSLLYKFNKSKHQPYLGIKYHINSLVHDNQNNVHKNRFYAFNFWQHFGIQGGYNYKYPLNDNVNLIGFYDNQLTFSGSRSEAIFPVAIGDNGEVLYILDVIEFKEIKAMEQNFGLGLEVDLTYNLFLDLKFGGGIAYMWDIPFEYAPGRFFASDRHTWEFSTLFTVGLGIKLNNK